MSNGFDWNAVDEALRTAERRAAQRTLVRRQLTATEPASRLAEGERHIVRRAFADISGRTNADHC